MATTVRAVPCFPDENPIPRSFPLLPSLSRPPLESRSMKSRKSFLDLLVPARRLASANPKTGSGSKLKQASEPTESMAPARSSDVKASDIRSRDTQNKPTVKQKTSPAEPTSKDPVQGPRSRSRTILRVISTTFRSRSPAPSTSPPPASTNLQAKQIREDALRERGLLPPKPNKDLSRQEADLDRNIPIVPPDRTSADDSAEPSAADLIRQKWEAKNNPDESAAVVENKERERMKSFRFGASSPSVSPIVANFPRSTQLETVAEANSPLPSPLRDSPAAPPVAPTDDAVAKASFHRSSTSAERIYLDPASVPLPSSPLPSPPPTLSKAASQKSTSISSATGHPVQHGDIDSSSNYSGHNRSGSRSSSTAPLPPVISLTPPEHFSTPAFVTSIPPHRRSESLAKMPSISESSSMMTPSLDASPGSPTTISTLNTTESVVVSGPNSVAGPKGKHGLLKVKTQEQVHPISMIIECPVEETPVAPTLTPEATPEETPLPLPSASEDLAVPAPLTRRGRDRGLTDPGKPEKRNFFNPFNRGQSLGREGSNGNSRISVVSSFSNLRRAASNFSKARTSSDAGSIAPSTLSGKAKTFDASHLPPSPTVPGHLKTSGPDPCLSSPPNRKALGPTLHSRASILMEMNAIKDDEVRRMTEVAFLG